MEPSTACSDRRKGRESNFMSKSILHAAMAGAIVWCAAAPGHLAAQTGTAKAAAPAPTPRTPDGHPDLSGVWWRGADVGGRGFNAGGGGRGAGGRGAAPPTFPS